MTDAPEFRAPLPWNRISEIHRGLAEWVAEAGLSREVEEKVAELVADAAASGALTKDGEPREILTGIMRYWAAYIRLMTGRAIRVPRLASYDPTPIDSQLEPEAVG